MAAKGESGLDLSYFREKASGFYWEPGKHVQALGFQGKALGKDRRAAELEADRLNKEVVKERAKVAQQEAEAKVSRDTVGWVIDQYQEDEAYLNLGDRTRRSYDQCLARIREWAGDTRAASVTSRAVQVWYRSLRKATPSFANHIMSVLQIVMRQAIVEGLIQVNPVTAVKRSGTKPRQRVWSEEALHAFCKMAVHKGWGSVALAVTLDYNMGQREGDILKLGWPQWNGKTFTVKQSKTDALIEVPFIDEVREVVAAAFEAKQSTLVVLHENTKAPWNEHTFRHVVAEIRAAAIAGDAEAGLPPCPELEGLWFMDLRRTAVVTLARAGATIPEITAITGHTAKSAQTIIETYLPRDSEMAANAVTKLAAYRERKAKSNG